MGSPSHAQLGMRVVKVAQQSGQLWIHSSLFHAEMVAVPAVALCTTILYSCAIAKAA